LEKAALEGRRLTEHFEGPDIVPDSIVLALTTIRDAIVAEEVRRNRDLSQRELDSDLARLNWALVLPLISEDALIGLIAVGPKLSGDPFYPHDLDLLMTLANQAGVAIKNAQLYTQVVLANEYISNIVATIESGVVAIDRAGRITIFNRAAEELTGQTQPDTVKALPTVLSSLLTTTVADGIARTEPEIALTAGTHTRPVICATSPLRDPSGAVLGAVAVFSDLTPLKELEIERRRAERLRYFEALAATIAHEIKNPLVGIKTFVQLVPRRIHDDRFAEEFGRVATREIGRMERLVQRLSALSQPSDRPKQQIDVRVPLGEAVEFLKPGFDEKRIAVCFYPGSLPRFVLADHNELEQLFINLLMNAYEATPPDGTVAIEVSGVEEHVIVGVADSGPGIPPELLERVFDPFYTTKQRGSGLGLTICAGIAAGHRAKLRAANRPGGGALFTVEFPVVAAVEAPTRA
jgi:PAS domain S-box-containing protein